MKRTILLAVKLAVSIALLTYLFTTTDLSALGERIRTGDTLYFAFAVVLYAGMLGLATWRWHLLLDAQGFPVSLRHLSCSYLVASFFNNFLPSNIGGDIVRVRDSSRLTGSTTTSVAVIAIDRILGFGALYFLGVLAFVSGGAAVRQLAGARAMLAAFAFVFGGMAYLFFRPGTSRRFMTYSGLASFDWVREQFEIVQGAVHVYRTKMGVVWTAFGASVALQALVIWYFYAIARALQIQLPLGACSLMVPLCSLLQAVPISFNGWGIRESVFTVYFAQLGLSRDKALAFSLVGAGLVVLLSLSGAVMWAWRGREENGSPASE